MTLLLHSLNASATDSAYAAVHGTAEVTDDPDGAFHQVIYGLYMGGSTPPPEPGAHRLIVRIHLQRAYAALPFFFRIEARGLAGLLEGRLSRFVIAAAGRGVWPPLATICCVSATAEARRSARRSGSGAGLWKRGGQADRVVWLTAVVSGGASRPQCRHCSGRGRTGWAADRAQGW